MNVITHTKKDFAWTKWGEKDIDKISKDFILHIKRKYTEIKNIPTNERTFENTVFAVESSDYDVMDSMQSIGLLMEVSPIDNIRRAAKRAIDKTEKELIEISHDEGIYKAIKEYINIKTPICGKSAKELKGEDKKLLDDMLIGFRRMGFDLSLLDRKILKTNLKKLAKLSSDFLNNINEYKDNIEVTKEELDGLPENYINGLKKNKKGKYIVTLEYPDYGPFVSNSKCSHKRRELVDKNFQKGGKKNIKLLNEVLELRAKNAKLLGYKNHADFKIETKMAKNSKNVSMFLNKLIKSIKKKAKEDLNMLENIKKIDTNNKNAKLMYYDIGYYANKSLKEQFNIDTEKVREYFPFKIVKNGTFEIYSKLFSVKFVKLTGYPLWHKDVEIYAVKDKDKIISYFILDMYPRKNKFGHAAVFSLVSGRNEKHNGQNVYVAPIKCMIANFPKPRQGSPSILSLGEVETFFHEFGHLMHGALTRAKYASQSGTSVALDFVEAPSQMFENWVWDKKMLNILSEHYKTKKNLPKILLDNMIKAKKHLMYYSTMRQLSLALFDLNIHSGKIKNICDYFNFIMYQNTGSKMPTRNIFPAGFGHLIGYDAGYYSYMWSKVYSSDMFTKFKREGLLNKKIGMKYRKQVLEKGSSEEEIKLLEKFLGRKSNNKAFLEEIGL
jgi:thimet oligopeptidase